MHRDGEGPTRTADDTILYGAEFETLTMPEQVGLLAHHVLHVALRHGARQAAMAERIPEGFHPDIYVLATDALVNEALLQGGHALPRPAVRAAELVAAAGLGADTPQNLLAHWDADRLYLALAHDGDSATRRKAARGYATAQGFRPDLEGQHGAEDQTNAELWTARVTQALATGRAAGSGTGAALAAFGDLSTPRVPWERVLRKLMARALRPEPRLSHRRPANGWIARDAAARAEGRLRPVYEPGRARDALQPRIVVAVDTSSSITDRQLDLFAAEALALHRRLRAEVHVLGFDVTVHTHLRLHQGHDSALHDMPFRRGGGTAFAAVVDAAARLAPSVLVILTDLDGPHGPAPGFPVIWAVPKRVPPPAPFGRVVAMVD